MTAIYEGEVRVYANTYGEAIEKAGGYFDHLWESGNWRLKECRVEPHLYDNAGEPLAWRWDITVSWLGQQTSP